MWLTLPWQAVVVIVLVGILLIAVAYKWGYKHGWQDARSKYKFRGTWTSA